MLNFKPVTMDDKGIISAYFQKKNFYSAKYSFTSCYVWRDIYSLKYAEENGFLFFQVIQEGDTVPSYLCPVGEGDLVGAVEAIDAYCKEKGQETILYGIFETEKAILENAFGDRLKLQEERDSFDYIYSREKLATLSGKKLHGKRNHIARFQDKAWQYEQMTVDKIPAVMAMHRKWAVENEVCKEHSEVWHESCATAQAFDNFEALGLVGGILYQEGEIVGYTMGEPLTEDTFVVHFEKAFPEIQGAYPALNQQFVKHEMEQYTYVNREEDTGDAGLRKAKLSYYPEILLTEYSGVLK